MKKRKKNIRTVEKCMITVFIATVFLILYIYNNAAWAEVYYSQKIYPIFATILSTISGLIPFSLWDVFWVFFVGFTLVTLFQLLFLKGKRWFALRRYLVFLVGGIVWFYWSWGFNYFRESPEVRLDLPAVEADSIQLFQVLDSLILEVNEQYTSSPWDDRAFVDEELERIYETSTDLLLYPYPNGCRRPKEMLFSNFIAKSSIFGYFGPFFNEIHTNTNLLPTEFPFTLAHEKAHQFGIASEAECNLWAYVITQRSDVREIRYSGTFSVLQYFLREAAYFESYPEYLKKIDQGVIDDIREERAHWRALRDDKINEVQSTMYDAYLKTNQVQAGIRDYNRVVQLVIAWESRAWAQN